MKGILSKDQEKQISRFLDELIDFTKFKGIIWNVVELADGKIFQVGISYLDDNFGDKLPAGIKEEAGNFLVAVIDKDQEKILLYGTHLINKLVDIPGITEDNEAILIGSILEGLIKAIFNHFDV